GEVVGDMLVEAAVVLVLELALRARPQRRSLVHDFPFVGRLAFLLERHTDREADVIGIARDEAAQLPALQELVLVGFQMQRHARAARRVGDVFERVFARAFGLPAHAGAGFAAGAARGQRHAVGDDEGRVETDAELANQIGVGLLFAAQRLEELARARARDRADVRDDFVAAHADAVVADRDRARVFVVAHLDRKFGRAG